MNNRIMMVMQWPGATTDQYEQLRKEVNWEGKKPAGGVVHIAAFDNDGAHLTDVWESEEDLNNFINNRLMPAIQKLGIPGQPETKIYPLHELFTPGI